MPEQPEVAGSTAYFERWALGAKIASKAPRIVRGPAACEPERELSGRTFISPGMLGWIGLTADPDGWIERKGLWPSTRAWTTESSKGYFPAKRVE